MSDPTYRLLLELSGRVDDDLLATGRELVAVGEEGHALELLVAELVAGRVVLPADVRLGLVTEAAARRVQPDADRGLPDGGRGLPDGGSGLPDGGDSGQPNGDRVCGDGPHRFTALGPAERAEGLAQALAGIAEPDGGWLLAWRVTPAGSAPGPLPHPVLLGRAISDGSAEVLTYQAQSALELAGHTASVEVRGDGDPDTGYHRAARAVASPLPTAGPTAGSGPAGVSGPAIASGPAVAELPQSEPAEWGDAVPGPAASEPAVSEPAVSEPATPEPAAHAATDHAVTDPGDAGDPVEPEGRPAADEQQAPAGTPPNPDDPTAGPAAAPVAVAPPPGPPVSALAPIGSGTEPDHTGPDGGKPSIREDTGTGPFPRGRADTVAAPAADTSGEGTGPIPAVPPEPPTGGGARPPGDLPASTGAGPAPGAGTFDAFAPGPDDHRHTPGDPTGPTDAIDPADPASHPAPRPSPPIRAMRRAAGDWFGAEAELHDAETGLPADPAWTPEVRAEGIHAHAPGGRTPAGPSAEPMADEDVWQQDWTSGAWVGDVPGASTPAGEAGPLPTADGAEIDAPTPPPGMPIAQAPAVPASALPPDGPHGPRHLLLAEGADDEYPGGASGDDTPGHDGPGDDTPGEHSDAGRPASSLPQALSGSTGGLADRLNPTEHGLLARLHEELAARETGGEPTPRNGTARPDRN